MREPPRLGRGLASLLGDALNPAITGGTAGSTSIDDIEPNPFQPRTTVKDEDIGELAASIRVHGLLQPILLRRHPARPGMFQIVAGERRWRAARLAGLTHIASFVRDLPDNAASAAALVENLQRQDLNPVEEAEGFKRLMTDFGLTQDDLARSIGKSRSHVANTLRLLQLPAEVLQHLGNGTLSAGHARAALASPDPVAAAKLMLERGLSVRQAEALTMPRQAVEDAQPRASAVENGSADLRAVEEDLGAQLGLKVSISFNGRGGTISLRYQSLDQLDHVVAKLGRT